MKGSPCEFLSQPYFRMKSSTEMAKCSLLLKYLSLLDCLHMIWQSTRWICTHTKTRSIGSINLIPNTIRLERRAWRRFSLRVIIISREDTSPNYPKVRGPICCCVFSGLRVLRIELITEMEKGKYQVRQIIWFFIGPQWLRKWYRIASGA